MPFKFIANDGNLVVNPITVTELDEQGIAERYDIVVDFSQFGVGSEALSRQHADDARRRARARGGPVARARRWPGDPDDPVVGTIMEFRVVELGAESSTRPARR